MDSYKHQYVYSQGYGKAAGGRLRWRRQRGGWIGLGRRCFQQCTPKPNPLPGLHLPSQDHANMHHSAGTGPSTPYRLAGAYPGIRAQTSPFSKGDSRGQNSPVGYSPCHIECLAMQAVMVDWAGSQLHLPLSFVVIGSLTIFLLNQVPGSEPVLWM